MANRKNLLSGQEYPGRHEPLISQELFDRVQRVLDQERHGGKRDRTHHHYLKALLWCARCRRRLIIMRGKSHNGSLYFYWLCMGRRERGACDLPYLPVEQVEDEVVRHYATVQLSNDIRTTIQTRCATAMADRHGTQTQIQRQLAKRLADLERQEDAYLDLVGHPDWPQDKLSRKMRQITEEKSRLQEQLGTADVDLTTGQTIIQELCQLLAEPKELYQRASRRARRTLNKAIFTRLYIDTHQGSRPTVASDELSEHVAPLVHAARHRHTPDLRRSRKAGHTPAAEAAHTNCADHPSGEGKVTLSEVSLTELANHAFGSGCSSRA